VRFESLPEPDDPIVSLRPIVAADLPVWAAILWLPAVFEHTSWDLRSVEDLSPHVWAPEARTDSTPLRLAIVSNESGAFVGTIGFHSVFPQNRSAELAYELAPQVWGRGIATRLCRELTRWGHDAAGLIRIQAAVLVSNERSIRVLERGSFEREGTLRSYRMVRGRPGDFYMYSHVVPLPAAT
jgi:ribosomal-protein-alanine N-acetyltransferase